MATKRTALDKRLLKALGFIARDVDWQTVDLKALQVELKARGIVEALDRTSALTRVLECGPFEAVMAVLAAGASVNNLESTDDDRPQIPLAALVVDWPRNEWMTVAQQCTLLEALSTRGVDLNAVGANDGEDWNASALDVAMLNERSELAAWLLARPLTQQTLASAVRRASRAWSAGVPGAPARLAKVLERLERPHQAGRDGLLPLTAAALHGPVAAVESVLQAGARATDALSQEVVEFVQFAITRPPCSTPALRLAAGTNTVSAVEGALRLLEAAQARDDWNADARAHHHRRLKENLKAVKG